MDRLIIALTDSDRGWLIPLGVGALKGAEVEGLTFWGKSDDSIGVSSFWFEELIRRD